MQFHPLAYMVKLKIEMSMAELIAKVSKMKEKPNALHQSSGYAAGSREGSVNRSAVRRSKKYPIQPVPPATNAVSFKIFQTAEDPHWTPSTTDDLSGSMSPSTRRFASCRSDWTMSPDSSEHDLHENAMELYVVREVTVETETMRRSSFSRGESSSTMNDNGLSVIQGQNRTDDQAPLRENQSQLVWGATNTVSTAVHVGPKLDA
jgi:hypothetical protein